MTTLELNDWQLVRRDDNGVALEQEPAAASAAKGGLVFGRDALACSRSHPQQFNNRYLHSLSADPIAGDLGRAKNHADLVYQHLLELELPADEGLCLAIPGYLTNDQLGLLLGICQEAGLSVHGFVETALAHTLHLPANGASHVLDIEMYRLCLTEIADDGQSRRVVRSSSIDGLGVGNLVEGWMNVIADEFVHKTRFDPLHAGAVEQQLFDQVYGWLGRKELADERIRVTQGEAVREMEVSARALQEKLAQRLAAADLSQVHALAVSPRVQAVPGFTQALAQSGISLIALDEVDVVANFARLRETLDPGSVRRVSNAAVRHNGGTATPAPTAATPGATHLLANHVAVSIGDPRFAGLFEPSTGACLSAEVQINGQTPTAGQVLGPGDHVTCHDADFTAIRLE